MHWLLTVVILWAVGFLASHLIRLLLLGPGGTCPKCPKCWAGSVAAILFGVAYILVVIKRPPSWGPILTYTLVLSAVVAAAVYLGLCPIPPKDGVAR